MLELSSFHSYVGVYQVYLVCQESWTTRPDPLCEIFFGFIYDKFIFHQTFWLLSFIYGRVLFCFVLFCFYYSKDLILFLLASQKKKKKKPNNIYSFVVTLFRYKNYVLYLGFGKYFYYLALLSLLTILLSYISKMFPRSLSWWSRDNDSMLPIQRTWFDFWLGNEIPHAATKSLYMNKKTLHASTKAQHRQINTHIHSLKNIAW